MKRISMALMAVCAALLALSASATETIAYWPFGESGLNDASGNGHTLEGGAAITDCATLGGTTDTLLKTVNALDLSGCTDVTVEFFVKAADQTSLANLIEHSSSVNANAGGFQVTVNERDTNHRVCALWHAAAGAGVSSLVNIDSPAEAISDGRWHHIAVVIKSKSTATYSTANLTDYCVSLYIDRTAVANSSTRALQKQTGRSPLRSDTLFIGSRNGAEYMLNAMIDDIRITNGALVPSDFLQSRTGASVETIAYWPFGGEGLADASGHGHDLHHSANGVTLTDGAVQIENLPNFFFQTWKPLDLSDYSDGLTVECFFKSSDADTASMPVLAYSASRYNAGVSSLLMLSLHGGKVTSYARSVSEDSASKDESADGGLNDGKWHHLAWVYDPAFGDHSTGLYIDGVLQKTTATNPFAGLRKGFFHLGAASYNSHRRQFGGFLDDVRITGAALTADHFLSSRTETEGPAASVPDYEPYALANWKFSRHAELKDESGLYDLQPIVTDAVSFDDGAAVFSGLGGLWTQSGVDLLPYGKVTIEFFVSYPELRKGDTSFSMVFLEQAAKGLTFNERLGCFQLGSDVAFMSNPGVAGALLTLSTYRGNIYGKTDPHYGDGSWHRWTYTIDVSGSTTATALYIDGNSVPLGESPFNGATKVPLNSEGRLTFGGRAGLNVATGKDWRDLQNLYGRIDDVRITVGACLEPSDWQAERSAEGLPVAEEVMAFDFEERALPFASSVGGFVAEGLSGQPMPIATGGTVRFAEGGALKVSPATRFSGCRQLTVEAVFRAEMPALGAEQMLFELGETYSEYGANRFYCMLDENGCLRGGVRGNGKQVVSGAVRKGAWNHLALVIDLDYSDVRRQISLFLNGCRANQIAEASIPAQTMRDDSSLYLGARYGTPTKDRFAGEFSDFVISKTALLPGAFVLSRPNPVPGDGVLAYWPINSAEKGTKDASGCGNILSPEGFVYDGEGAVSFAGGAGISTAGFVPFDAASQLTVECFVKACAVPADGVATLFKTCSGALTEQVGVLGVELLPSGQVKSTWVNGIITEASGKAHLRVNTKASAAGVLSDGNWHHIALVVDPTLAGTARAKLYVDRVEAGTLNPDAYGDREQPFVADRMVLGEGFAGKISDVRVTARALGPEGFLQDRTEPKGIVIVVK